MVPDDTSDNTPDPPSDNTSDPVHCAPEDTLIYPVRARARTMIVHQHQGCVKNSIKLGPNLMLVLTAPNPDPGWTGFDAGFNTGPKWRHFGPLKMTHHIYHTGWHV